MKGSRNAFEASAGWGASWGDGEKEQVGRRRGSGPGTINQREGELLPGQGSSETLGRSGSPGGAGLMAAIGVPQRDFLCPLAAGQAARPACPHGAWCRQPQQRGPGPGSALSTAEPSSCGGRCPTGSGQGCPCPSPPAPGRSGSRGAHSGSPTFPPMGFLHPQVIFLGLPSLPRAAWHMPSRESGRGFSSSSSSR